MNDVFKRRVVVIGIMLLIALLHILPPENYLEEAQRNLYYSYFSDIVMPFGAYFLLRQMEVGRRSSLPWWANLAGAFLLPALLETCQYFGIPALGSTFDPLDYAAYASGAGSAALVDTQLFSRIFRFWK